MQVIQLYSSAATYISSMQRSIMTKCKEILELGYYKEASCNFDKTEVLIKFDFNCLNYSTVCIKKAYLSLSIPKWCSWADKHEYEVIIKTNEEPFDKQWVNWHMRPKSEYYSTVYIGKCALENKEVNIDITDLVKEWISGSRKNYGITLETKETEFLMYIASDCTQLGPKISFYCENDSEVICPCTPSEALQLQVKNRPMELIEDLAPVRFDDILTKISNEISYDELTHEIVINKIGVYTSQWWISIDGSGDINELSFALQNSDESIKVQCSAPVFVLSQLFGNAIINITKVPERLKLVNRSGANIQFANVTVQSSLTIAEI